MQLLALCCLTVLIVLVQADGDVSENAEEPLIISDQWISNSTRGLNSGNQFWDLLYHDCGKKTSFRCVQRSIFGYLDKSLAEKDVYVTDNLVFRRNHNGFSLRPSASALWSSPVENRDNDAEDDDDNELESPESIPTIEDITDELYGKGMNFIQSHDLVMRLPSFVGGAEVRLAPRAFEEDGATFKISFSRPKEDVQLETARTGRIFSKRAAGILKKITQKLFKKKLMTSFFALLLIVKLIKVKLMFLLPLILGVGTAKKILLKVLLFLFPALSHLFKLCSYYHANYAKYHHHHHKIAHHHHVIPVPVPAPVHQVPAHPGPVPHNEYGPGPAYPSDVGGAALPPTGSYDSGLNPGPHGAVGPGLSPSPGIGNFGTDWPSGGGYDYAHNRNENVGVLPAQHQANDAALASWGLAAAPMTGVANYWDNQQPYMQAATNGLRGVKRKTGATAAQTPAPASPSQTDLTGIKKVVGPTVVVAYDPFYSPLLQRMDNVFVQLGFNEEACRERLVCSMYKSPARFAPHSNLISAELSRDANELQKPSSLNSAVVRFYRYVQAARDGQTNKDCLALYPACTVNTNL